MFRTALDRQCQRGLHWRYVVDGAWWRDAVGQQDRLFNTLEREDAVCHRVETWGSRPIHFFAVPFRYEIRLWTRPQEASLIHRASASMKQRKLDRNCFEISLTEWLLGSRSTP